ncbi:hypothetical protein GUJ93_ZPchr0009g1915 [Zizania palustris]|uniref:Uncharacterized protein n=1 Tax=Zizania palustris TaxID=103762 RepID=A0A8J5R2Z9_ZIZPA|nr:hypothetical protein GUJ93_ZPchr0009g1915 [Zizania palustris]
MVLPPLDLSCFLTSNRRPPFRANRRVFSPAASWPLKSRQPPASPLPPCVLRRPRAILSDHHERFSLPPKVRLARD